MRVVGIAWIWPVVHDPAKVYCNMNEWSPVDVDVELYRDESFDSTRRPTGYSIFARPRPLSLYLSLLEKNDRAALESFRCEHVNWLNGLNAFIIRDVLPVDSHDTVVLSHRYRPKDIYRDHRQHQKWTLSLERS